ncbi:hypothetical protein BDW66DRAFT_146961 [Aspergillus desertorum]
MGHPGAAEDEADREQHLEHALRLDFAHNNNRKNPIRDETMRKWHRPFGLWATITVCSIGAAVQDWDQLRYAHEHEQCFDEGRWYLTGF